MHGVRRGAVPVVAGLLLALAACSSGNTQVSAQDKPFVTAVRKALAEDGTTHSKRSDSDLASAGESMCKQMKAGKFSDAYSALKSSGYSPAETADVESTAVQTLCTAQRQKYFSWLSTPANG